MARWLPIALVIAFLALLVVDLSLWFAGGLTIEDALVAYLLTNTIIAGSSAGTERYSWLSARAHTIGRLFLGIALFYNAESTSTGPIAGPYQLSASVE